VGIVSRQQNKSVIVVTNNSFESSDSTQSHSENNCFSTILLAAIFKSPLYQRRNYPFSYLYEHRSHNPVHLDIKSEINPMGKHLQTEKPMSTFSFVF